MVKYPPLSAEWEERLKTGSRTGSASTISSGSEDSGSIIISGTEELSGIEDSGREEVLSLSGASTGSDSEKSHPEEEIIIAERINAVKSFFVFVTFILREILVLWLMGIFMEGIPPSASQTPPFRQGGAYMEFYYNIIA